MPEPKGLIFDIKRFAIHDGPGIRTTVFFKGCPLSCWWCHNPEAIDPQPELILFESKCIACGECFKVCAQKAHEARADGSRVYHREECVLCGECVEVCYAGALAMQGKEVTVEEVMGEITRDVPFYDNSNGGITLSGGEPMLQPEFALALVKQCRGEGLHVAMDTSGHVPWRVFEKVLSYVDLVLYDIKQIDDTRHQTHTGISNKLNLDNLKRVGDYGVPVEIRMPIIPGINDAPEDITRAGQFLSGIKGIIGVELLPYHGLGEPKYVRLGREYKLPGLDPPGRAEMNEIAERIRTFELEVHVSG